MSKPKRVKINREQKNSDSNNSNDLKKSIKKPPFWFKIVLFAIPFALIFLIELSLRIFGYGKDYSQWVKIAPGQLVLNPDVAYRYFHSTEGVPYSNQNSFFSEKSETTFRVFIMGGSSAAGYPYTPNGDFGLYLKKKLEILYPAFDIEVINIALTATNSYTVRDLLPGVIDQKPDLVLFYTGHNEFYGAYGVGSMESIGQSRVIVNFILSLEKYKTFNLLRDFLQWIQKLFAGGNSDGALKKSGTLMSRMVKDQTIPFNSDVYDYGIEQFRGNFDDILSMCKESKIPVIISTLTCNLRDQPPFVSLKVKELPEANDVYNRAKLNQSDSIQALKDFIYAKDLDGLRFRAPQKINDIIIEYSKKYNIPIVDIDSVFNSVSPYGITGDNLMTDHLHPTFDGYKLIGKSFFEVMNKNNFLPKTQRIKIEPAVIDSLTNQNVYITKLDSIISKYRILVLKNDWPYSEPKTVAYMLKLFNQQNKIDSIAVKVLDNRYSWERGHREAAEYYLHKEDYNEFVKEANVLITQYPFIKEYYSFTVEQLLSAKKFDDCYPFLIKAYKRFPDALFAKWIGIIDLSKERIDNAIFYLNESLKYSSRDAQVYFNLSGAYSKKKMYNEALNSVNSCLALNPNYSDASRLKEQLSQIIRLRK
ncbi:MAG: hypothetical protein ROY99_00990 [Ignavibacterium sp.]|nr:hypothetical protein [Ignavibacterium sp.]